MYPSERSAGQRPEHSGINHHCWERTRREMPYGHAPSGKTTQSRTAYDRLAAGEGLLAPLFYTDGLATFGLSRLRLAVVARRSGLSGPDSQRTLGCACKRTRIPRGKEDETRISERLVARNGPAASGLGGRRRGGQTRRRRAGGQRPEPTAQSANSQGGSRAVRSRDARLVRPSQREGFWPFSQQRCVLFQISRR